MSTSRALVNAERVKELAAGLALVPEVARFDTMSEPQASTLAQTLADIEESSSVILNQGIPRLMAALADPEALQDVLVDIGEELAHILYHIRDAKYYGYVVERVESSSG